MSNEMCSDNRFELIANAKSKLFECTNIESSPDEVAVLDSILFRCWQMGWLDKQREEIVRCRDCVHLIAHGAGCSYWDYCDVESTDGFCAWGERKSE